jgi:isopenicillin-N epimerase
VRFGHAALSAFALHPDVTFLNHGSFGAAPRAVLAAQQGLRDEMEARPIQFLARELPGRLRRAAERLSDFVCCDPDDLVFVDNATSGVNAVVRSLDFAPGDEIITTSHVYPAVRNVLNYVASRTGARVVEVRIPFPIDSPLQIVKGLREGITAKTRLAVVDWISSASGLVFPIEDLVAECRHAGVPVLVDAAHVLGQLPMDLAALDADWVTANAHKWLFAPKGSAMLWARKEQQSKLTATVVSHGQPGGFIPGFDWTGTRDPSPYLCVEAALDFVDEVGVARMRAYNRDLADRAANMLARRWGVSRPAPSSMCANLVSLPIPTGAFGTKDATMAEADAAAACMERDHGIAVPLFAHEGQLWLRISAQIYNQLSDYERLAEL